MPALHPYRRSNAEFAQMSDADLREYIAQLQAEEGGTRGYGLREIRRELTRARKILRSTEEDPDGWQPEQPPQ